jgi:hypothetical protein
METAYGKPGFGLQQVPAMAQPDNAIRRPHMAVDDFLPSAFADELRAPIDEHFAEPHSHTPEIHQVWNYWFVPDLYTYLRTRPEKVIPMALVQRFHDSLSRWARENLGMAKTTWPYLSLYVDGCQQGLHNDSANGRFGYVYSLTWDDRKTIGGETIVLREGDLFRTNMWSSAAGLGIYELIEPRFNRLALFDDRMPHGVNRVEGSMDPLEGRFVLHGHISEGGPIVEGGLEPQAVADVFDEGLAEVAAELLQAGYHGPLSIHMLVDSAGEVRIARTMLDRVARLDGGSTADAVERVLAIVRGLRFPAAPVGSEIRAPLLIGGPLPPRK